MNSLTVLYGLFGFLTLLVLPGIVSRDDYNLTLIRAWIAIGLILCILVVFEGEYYFPLGITLIGLIIYLAQKRK